MMTLEPSRLIGDHRVAHRVGFVEGVVGKIVNLVENILRSLFRNSPRDTAADSPLLVTVNEGSSLFLDFLSFLF
ncbi:hypothetical protein SDC9_132104 [bioreactor metagenome]|uniref:Uncharacterized protein n=1 Tax=bioreactor metagenome TaxID=1076179 RepID=A0A645D766_9ZZZZ